MKASKGNNGLASRVVAGDQAAAGRALSVVVNESEGFEALGRSFFAYSGRAHKIGVCGPPGCGKSTLINRLLAQFRKAGEKVGVLAVDPTSPWTGGAFLGDRLRVQEHAMDPGVFFRSLGSRGTVGGLTATIFGAIHVLEAYGCQRILLETVGTGQDEVEISHVADTVLYLTAPSLGDEIQAMKAGAMEAADIVVLNKADLAGKDRALAALREAFSLAERESAGWKMRIAATSAASGEGIEELLRLIAEHRAYLSDSEEGRRRAKDQLRMELFWLVSRRLHQNILSQVSDRDLEAMLEKTSDPWTLGEQLVSGGRGLDHVGVAVSSIRSALPFYQDQLGLRLTHEETVVAQGVRVAFLAPPSALPGACQVELLEPLAEGAVSRFIDKRGPGLHHIAFHSSDIRSDMRRLREAGSPPIESEPRPGSRGHRVCFLHPKSAHGVLVELVAHA